MKRILVVIAATLALACVAPCCSDDDDSTDGGSDGDTDSDSDADTDADGDTGTIAVTGNWDGSAPDGTGLRVSVFGCPFTMPPDYYFEGTWDSSTGDVAASQDGVTPGEWCLMAYIDIDSTDGLRPVDGTDAVNSTGDENEEGAIPITVTAGETTTVDLSFEL